MTTSRADMTDLVKRLRYADHDADKRNAADAIEAERLKRQQAEHERHCILEDLAGAEKDAERDARRISYLEVHVFDGHWDGTIGRPKSWRMAGPYRHELMKWQGNDLRAAIDAALAQEPKP